MYGMKSDWMEEPQSCHLELEDYQAGAARWCPGCGDHAVLTAVQRICRDEQIPLEQLAMVSGIGCSSRFPHYMKTYGFHGLHGRAFPVAEGVRARRPDLKIFVSTGDGDCTSIGAGHWIHAIRYNMKMVAMLFDNHVYGLTKKQTSPTSLKGQKTNTHPRGAWLDPINPIQTTLGVTNVSFVAQTIDWHPAHLLATLRLAYAHDGFAFVRILQRCPHYTPHTFTAYQDDPSKILLMNHPDGVVLDPKIQKTFPTQTDHDPYDIHAARELADELDPIPIGLFYRNNEAGRYDLATVEGLATPRAEKIKALKVALDKFRI